MQRDKIIEESKKIRENMKKQVGTYILAGFGLVASLAWNDAIKALIEKFFPATSGNDLCAKLFYALVVTGIVVLVSYFLLRTDKEKE